jgi:hypothetical protein
MIAHLLRTSHDFCRVEPGFSDHAGQVELAGDFAAAAVAAVNMQDILRGSGQGP